MSVVGAVKEIVALRLAPSVFTSASVTLPGAITLDSDKDISSTYILTCP